MTQSTKAAVAVTHKKTLRVVTDTGANEKRLEQQGFTRDFQRASGEREVNIVLDTGCPATAEDYKLKQALIRIEGALIAYGQVESHDHDFRMVMLSTQRRTYFLVVNGPVKFIFFITTTSVNMKDAVRNLLNDNLLRGPKFYEKTAGIMPDFWFRLLSAVITEPEIIEINLRSVNNHTVPSRVYFNPNNQTESILSIGGYCFDYQLQNFPREEIAKGTGQWMREQEKRGTAPASVKLGNVIVKKGNKDKQRVKPQMDLSTLKPLSEHLKVHAQPEQAAKPEKVKPAAPVAEAKKPGKKKKAA